MTAPAIAPPGQARWAGPGRSLRGPRFYFALAVFALSIGGLSLLVPTTPSYDPWSWLVWGREIIHLDLHTTGGPSWKPLPVIFTTIFSLFGQASPDLWLVIARAGAVMAAVMTFKVAWRVMRRLSGEIDPEAGRSERLVRCAPALLAGLIAAASLINSRGFISDNALGYSEGLMTALVLIAFDRHLDGARRSAFAVGFFAALDRPELWLLWGPYGLYLFWKDPGARKLVIGLFVLIPVFWFLPELWGSGHFFRGVTRAQQPRSNSAAFADCPFCTEFSKHAWPTTLLRIKVVALVAMACAAFGIWRGWLAHRRGIAVDRSVFARISLLALGAVGFGWWVLIAILTQAGFSGNDRYLVLGVALVSIAGGVGWAWFAESLARLPRWLGKVSGLARSLPVPISLAAGLAAVIALFIALPPWLGRNVISLPRLHGSLVYQAHLREDVHAVIERLGGGQKILACGPVMTEGFQVPMVAWYMGTRTAEIEAAPLANPPPNTPGPAVIFQARANRGAHLLPLLSSWPTTHYTKVAHVRTFNVYSTCQLKVTA